MATPTTNPTYSKHRRQIVIALDVGTTFSGASYSIIQPGETPTIQGVNRYPGQAHTGGDAKIPSVILYDERGELVAIGPEANQRAKIEEEDGEAYYKVTWFKLHLRPAHFTLPSDVPALPPNKNAVGVFADFLKYLYNCVLDYISRRHFNGDEMVESLRGGIHFIITHPNGWEGPQQSKLRKAAIRAGLVKDMKDSLARISLLTEGEAAFHYCVRHSPSLRTPIMPASRPSGVMVIDAGGGTVDISAYTQDTDDHSHNPKLREIVTSRCIFHGSIFVTENARVYLAQRLKNSDCFDDIIRIVECFDEEAKCRFKDNSEAQYIKYGGKNDNDKEVGIRNGQLKIEGDVMAGFFQPAMDAMIKTVKELCEESRTISGIEIKHAFLVGGFATSEWLSEQLKIGLAQVGLKMSSPEAHLNKAVADGAISYYVDHFVSTRVSKHTYGITCYEEYDPSDIQHMRRSQNSFMDADGKRYIPGIFEPILNKGEAVKETKEFRKRFYRREEAISKFSNPMRDRILRYEGSNDDCKWMDQESHEMFPVMCTVKSDISTLLKYLCPKSGKLGPYYDLTYDIILSFGLTELKAEVEVRYNAKRKKETVKRFAAQIIYEEDSEEEDTFSDR